ncbi:MAG: acyl-CoA thioesterase [Bacteroidaceae bacterium]|nr:acyl-CoA thioesterase [Bacteroidaceae bacterium]
MREYQFKTEIAVRDYECDMQGIVNNANYLHYTEHTRHEFIRSRGLSFNGLHEQGIDVVVARMSMRFIAPLYPDDIIVSCMDMKHEGIKYVFRHYLFRKSDMRRVHQSVVECVCVINGKLTTSEVIDRAFFVNNE